jgi:hypothetical protein
MKQIYILTAILFFSLTKLIAQTTYVEIGDNPYEADRSETNQFIPTSFSKSKVQFLFTNTELMNANLINGSEIIGIEWYVNTDNTSATSTYDLYIDDDFTDANLSTNQNLGVNSTSFATITGTLVGSDLTDVGQYTGWHTATFTTPLIWDGTDNMVLQMCRTGGGQGVSDEISLAGTSVESYVTGYNHTCDATSGYYSRNHRPFFRLIVTSNTLSTIEYQIENSIKFYPNPSKDFIQISGLIKTESYKLFNTLGSELSKGNISDNEKIDIRNLKDGLYFLKFENGNTIKFIKE